MDSENPGRHTPDSRTEGEHRRPGYCTDGVRRAEFLRSGDVRQNRVAGRIEEAAHRKQKRGKGIEQPNIACITHEKEPENGDGTHNVRDD